MKNYGKLRDQRTSYLAKEQFLQLCYTQVSPMDFYRDVFAKGSLQATESEKDGLGCAIFRFHPDKSTYKRMRDRIRGELRQEIWRDPDSLLQYFSNLFDALPADSTDELERRYDKLDKAFNAGKYRKPGQAIETKWKFDQRVHDDLKELGEAIGKRWAIMAPISYYGRKANGNNARYLHAITLDLDGVGAEQLRNLNAAITNKLIPAPTYLVNSGHGLHLYYLLEEPVPLYRYVREPITKLKNALIDEFWNAKTSTIQGHKDDQPWSQMYRVVGSLSKLGTGYPATAYKVGNYTTLETLNDYLLEDERIQLPLEKYRPVGTSGYDIEYWKEHNPDWYRRRILKETDTEADKAEKSKVQQNFPWLYEKLKPRLQRYSRVGNRYNFMCVLFADASQSGIPYNEVYEFACSQIETLNIGVSEEKDIFTQEDIDCAAKYYATDFGHYMTLGRIEKMTGVRFPRNKRNRNSRLVHCAMMSATKEVKIKLGLCKDTRFGAEGGNKINKEGRPTAEQTIRAYLQEHPDSSKADVIRGTGLTKPTVYKWWKVIHEEVK